MKYKYDNIKSKRRLNMPHSAQRVGIEVPKPNKNKKAGMSSNTL